MEAIRQKEERISIRVNAHQKSIIDAAARAQGISTSSFILSNIIDAASRIVEQQHQIQLSERAWSEFVNLISVDIEPTPAALAAAARYKGQ